MESYLAHRPIGYSYRVDDRIFAGEYPVRDWNQGVRMQQIRHFTGFGITDFIDLTVPGEMPPYQQFLPSGAVRHGWVAGGPDIYPLPRWSGAYRYNSQLLLCQQGNVGRGGHCTDAQKIRHQSEFRLDRCARDPGSGRLHNGVCRQAFISGNRCREVAASVSG